MHKIPEKLTKYYSFLQSSLSADLLNHSIEIMQIMGELSETYSLNSDQAMLTGLLHDCGMKYSIFDMAALIKQGQIPEVEPEYFSTMYIHGPAGVYVCTSELNINDQELLTAIRCHTGLYPVTTTLTKCLCAADLLSSITAFDYKNVLRDEAYNGNIDKAMQLWRKWVLENYPAIGLNIHPSIKKPG